LRWAASQKALGEQMSDPEVVQSVRKHKLCPRVNWDNHAPTHLRMSTPRHRYIAPAARGSRALAGRTGRFAAPDVARRSPPRRRGGAGDDAVDDDGARARATATARRVASSPSASQTSRTGSATCASSSPRSQRVASCGRGGGGGRRRQCPAASRPASPSASRSNRQSNARSCQSRQPAQVARVFRQDRAAGRRHIYPRLAHYPRRVEGHALDGPP